MSASAIAPRLTRASARSCTPAGRSRTAHPRWRGRHPRYGRGRAGQNVVLRPEVRDDLPPVRSHEMQHVGAAGVDPLQLLGRLQLVPQRQRAAIERQRRVRIAFLDCTETSPNQSGCGRWAESGPKPNDVPAASTAAARGIRPAPCRSRGCGRTSDPADARRRSRRPRAGRAPRPGRGRPSRAGRARTGSRRARAESAGAVERRLRAPRQQPLVAVLARGPPVCVALGVRQPVARRVAHDVVVRQHPRRRGAGCRGQVEVVGDDAAELRGVEVRLEQIEVERLAETLGVALSGTRDGSTQASATAVRGGSYSLKTARHSA